MHRSKGKRMTKSRSKANHKQNQMKTISSVSSSIVSSAAIPSSRSVSSLSTTNQSRRLLRASTTTAKSSSVSSRKHIRHFSSQPQTLPKLREQHSRDIDRLQEYIQAKRYQSWLSEQSDVQSDEAMERLRESGMTPDDAKMLLKASMMTFLTHVESRASSAVGQGFYTIGPCGEELVGALALHIRPTDALALHYRHVSVQYLRQLNAGKDEDELLLNRARGHTVSIHDPVTGGAHCAIGGGEYDFIVTSTLASQSTPAVGRAMGSAMANWIKQSNPSMETLFPKDMVSFVSLGDGSINNGHFLSAANLAEYAAFRRYKCPTVFCITDNDISISLRGYNYLEKKFLNKLQMPIYRSNASDAIDIYTKSRDAIQEARKTGKPTVLYINNIHRRFGHAATDRQGAYMTQDEIQHKADSNPIESLSTLLSSAGVMSFAQQRQLFDSLWEKTKYAFDVAADEPKISSRESMLERLNIPAIPIPKNAAIGSYKEKTLYESVATKPGLSKDILADRSEFMNIQARTAKSLGTPLPINSEPVTTRDVMRKHMTRVYSDLMKAYPQMIYMGEDVTHGGYYLVSDGLEKEFPGRVRDFAPDETALLGAAMGFAQNGLLPVCEIPYIKYLDCAMDILTEAGIMTWLSNRKQPNGMIIRCQGFGSGKFGGNYHTTNYIYTLPGFDVVCYSNGPDYARGMRYSALQASQGRVVMTIDGTTLLNQRHVDVNDDAWRKPFTGENEYLDFDQVLIYKDVNEDGSDVDTSKKTKKIAVVTYGEGVLAALNTAKRLRESDSHITVDVIDCPLLNRVPEGLKDQMGNYENIVFADPCKDGMQPLANHAVLLQRDQLLPKNWSATGAQPTYNPLGSVLTFMNSDDILAEVLKVDAASTN